jgi:hypothetical protein
MTTTSPLDRAEDRSLDSMTPPFQAREIVGVRAVTGMVC